MVKELAASTQQLAATVHQNQEKTDGAIADLNKQMSQLATTMSELKNEPGRLPSQTVQTPRGNVNAVTPRSGKRLVVEPTEPEEGESLKVPEEEQTGPEALGTLGPDAPGVHRPVWY
ncbi:unnamed protein product [Rhodiola kirilowii]